MPWYKLSPHKNQVVSLFFVEILSNLRAERGRKTKKLARLNLIVRPKSNTHNLI